MKPTPPRPALPILPAAKSSPPGKANPLYTFHAYGRVGSDVVCWHCGSLPHCSMARTCLTAGGPTPGVIERARYSSCLKTRPTAAAREISPDLRISPQISAARGVRGGRGGRATRDATLCYCCGGQLLPASGRVGGGASGRVSGGASGALGVGRGSSGARRPPGGASGLGQEWLCLAT